MSKLRRNTKKMSVWVAIVVMATSNLYASTESMDIELIPFIILKS